MPFGYRGYKVLTSIIGAKDVGVEVPTKNNLATLKKKYLYMQVSVFKNHGQVGKSW